MQLLQKKTDVLMFTGLSV